MILFLVLIVQGKDVVFSVYQGAGSFYNVIPYNLMLGIPIAIMAFSTLALSIGLFRFVRGTGWEMKQLLNPATMMQAIWDVLSLRYLGGSGDGCNYEDDTYSHKRRWFHQALLYGFMSCIVSTSVAALYDHFFHWPAPYAFTSIPVVTGTLGGFGLLIGTAGLFWLKLKSDKRPLAERLLGMDVAFSVLLFLTSLSGLLLLLLRDTGLMGMLLIIHLGLVAGLFLTLPYSKFVHATYRFAALVRFADEKRKNPHGDGIA
jgi:citrate/tricarballylate utilization protein